MTSIEQIKAQCCGAREREVIIQSRRESPNEQMNEWMNEQASGSERVVCVPGEMCPQMSSVQQSEGRKGVKNEKNPKHCQIWRTTQKSESVVEACWGRAREARKRKWLVLMSFNGVMHLSREEANITSASIQNKYSQIRSEKRETELSRR